MQLTLSPTEDDVFLALWTVLVGMLPNGDAVFTGSIPVGSDQLTVSAISDGTIKLGDPVLGLNVTPGTVISDLQTAAGGVGVYKVSPVQRLPVMSGTVSTFIEVLQGQLNRVPEPRALDFITMVVLRAPRISTNLEAHADVTFTGAIAGGVLTVSGPLQGTVRRGGRVFGVGVDPTTTIRGYLTGSGGLGTYSVAPAQTVGAEAMAAGSKSVTQAGQWVIQLDVHGPNSSDAVAIISTLFRDGYAVDAFAAITDAIAPLFADDPRQMPFHGGEDQFEDRFVLEVNLQVNQSVVVDQQYAGSLSVNLIDVETNPASWPNAVVTAP